MVRLRSKPTFTLLRLNGDSWSEADGCKPDYALRITSNHSDRFARCNRSGATARMPTHCRDKSYADGRLCILRAKSETFEPEKMKSWANKSSWKPGAADELVTQIGALFPASP